MRSREIGARFAMLALGTLTPLLLLEGILRVLPVQTGLAAEPVDAQSPVFHFEPDRPFVYSKGWRFDLANEGRVNGAGFVSDIEYDPLADSPLLAVIGDSYVEALMVPFDETLHARLARAMGEKGRVYSFAASGAPLSQYLVWAEHARDVYRPDAAVFVVVGNDFDESLLSVKQGSGFHHFDDRLAPPWPLTRVDYRPSETRRALRRSALARYLVLNAQVGRVPALLRGLVHGSSTPTKRYVGNTEAAAPAERIAGAEAAVAEFLGRAPAALGLPPERVAILVDGIRPELYDAARLAAARQSFFGRMREDLLSEARARGFAAVDLELDFVAEHARSGAHFEFSTDYHWNSAGHAVAAAAVSRLPQLRTTFDALAPDTP